MSAIGTPRNVELEGEVGEQQRAAIEREAHATRRCQHRARNLRWRGGDGIPEGR